MKKENRLERLTAHEEEIMQAVWQLGSCGIRQIIEFLPPPHAPYTTIASVVKGLERKGYLRTSAYGKSYMYEAQVSQEEYSHHSIDSLVEKYFTGSYTHLLQFFAEKNKLRADELRKLIDLIESGDQEEEK